jgi:hypothetical protein
MKYLNEMKLIISLLFLSLWSRAQNLNGTWTTDCQQSGRKIQKINEPFIDTYELYYNDSNCQNLRFYFLDRGTFQRNSNQMDYRFSTVNIFIVDAKIQSYFIQQKMCGISAWPLNMVVDITGRSCHLFSPTQLHIVPSANEARYGIYKVEDQKLFFGLISDKNHNALSPSTRPNQWDPRFYSFQK